MAYHTNLRRVFDRWERAVEVANAYGVQTSRKHRVYRVGGWWRIAATAKPIALVPGSRRGRLPGYRPTGSVAPGA